MKLLALKPQNLILNSKEMQNRRTDLLQLTTECVSVQIYLLHKQTIYNLSLFSSPGVHIKRRLCKCGNVQLVFSQMRALSNPQRDLSPRRKLLQRNEVFMGPLPFAKNQRHRVQSLSDVPGLSAGSVLCKRARTQYLQEILEAGCHV